MTNSIIASNQLNVTPNDQIWTKCDYTKQLNLKAHIHSKDCLILFNHMFENHLDHEKIGQKIPIK